MINENNVQEYVIYFGVLGACCKSGDIVTIFVKRNTIRKPTVVLLSSLACKYKEVQQS